MASFWRGAFQAEGLVENRAHSVALFAMYYNFVRVHKTLRTTPATAVRFQITERPLAQGKVNPLREQGEMTASRALGRPRFWPSVLTQAISGLLVTQPKCTLSVAITPRANIWRRCSLFMR